MQLPKLYKLSSTGAQQEWEISTDDNIIITRWGKVGGKSQETQDVIKEGKNQGRSNETTPKEQAEAEATSQWEKKLKKGYVKSLAAADAGEIDDVITGGVEPMLAKRFDEQGDKVVYPAYVQPKFDGHRCIAVVDKKGSCTLWSRTRKPITGLPHINAAIENSGAKDIVLDGELYNHDYKAKFEELTSFIRNPEPKEGHGVVEYHIYDIADNSLSFKERLAELHKLSIYKPLVSVQTQKVVDEEELMIMFEIFLAQGYEGAMVRNAAGLYVNKRSVDLLKIKEFQDAEFEVVDVEEGRGKLAGKAIFVCANKQGTKFKAKMKGDQDELAKYWKKPSLAIGRMLTVQYQGLTGKNGVPRFPVGLRFREDV
jgi:ATP-dependent DNA ligase